MVLGFGRSLFLISAGAILATGSLYAQGAKDAFKEGVKLLRLGQDAQALEKFMEALNADPSNEEAYQLWKETHHTVWAQLMARKGDYAKVARRFLTLATLERKRRSADEEAIRPLVEKALSEDYRTRQEASLKLMSEHGEYAVPFLVDALSNADDMNQQIRAIACLEKIGRRAALPLIALLGSENRLLRLNAAVSLLYIGDGRALPALKRLAESDRDAGVREVATKAVAKIGGSAVPSSLDLYLKHAHGFLTGSPTLVRDGDISEVLWSLRDGALVSRPVPAQLFALELAKDSAYGALDVDPTSEDALVALARAYVAEKTVVDSTLAQNPEDEAMRAAAASVAEMGITVLAAGAKTIRRAVEENLAEGMIPAAVEALHALARVEDASSLGGSPLVAALSHPDKRVRYAAAMDLSRMQDAALEPAARDKVVAVLGQAVLEQAVRVVKVIDPDAGNRKVAMEAASKDKGVFVDAAASTPKALADLGMFPNVDVVVLNENLGSYTPWDVLGFLRKHESLKDVKVILVTADKTKAEEAYGDKVDAYIQGPLTGEALANRVDEVLKDLPMDENRKAASVYAVSAAKALARLGAGDFGVARVSAALVQAARRDAAVAVPALDALGRSAGADSISAVVAVLTSTKGGNETVCKAAAEALGRIMARTGQAPKAAVEALTGIASDSSLSAAMRGAAVAALGRAPLLPGERAKLLRSLRIDPGSVGGDDTED